MGSITNRTKLIKEQLAQGKEAANQLMHLCEKQLISGEFHVLAEYLSSVISKSFTESISSLSSESSEIDPDHQYPLGTLCEDQRSESSTESRKRPAPKDKRGCYNRRKNGKTRTVISPSIEDGQAWRKYGQKVILNSKHPRAYFRCTRKYDQGCKAIKQVQRMEGNPNLYQITYIGDHTCKDVHVAPQSITDSDHWSTVIVTSNTNIPSREQEYQLLNNSAVELNEAKEEIIFSIPQLNNNDNDVSFSIDSVALPQPDLFSVVESVYSYTDTSSHSLNLGNISDFDTAFSWLDNA